jgi:hypothetical protein
MNQWEKNIIGSEHPGLADLQHPKSPKKTQRKSPQALLCHITCTKKIQKKQKSKQTPQLQPISKQPMSIKSRSFQGSTSSNGGTSPSPAGVATSTPFSGWSPNLGEPEKNWGDQPIHTCMPARSKGCLMNFKN